MWREIANKSTEWNSCNANPFKGNHTEISSHHLRVEERMLPERP